MAKFALVDPRIYVGGHDMTTDLNQIGLDVSVSDVDVTTFGTQWRSRVGGLKTATVTHSGYWDATVDGQVFPSVGAQQVVTVTDGAAGGARSFSLGSVRTNYQLLGQVGDATPFNGTLMSSGAVVRGRLVRPKAAATVSNGTAYQIGAVAAGEALYAAIHVTAAGTTLDVVVESDDASGFPDATVRSTTTVTTTGGTLVKIPGPVADDWWRVRFANLTGSFTVAVTLGVA